MKKNKKGLAIRKRTTCYDISHIHRILRYEQSLTMIYFDNFFSSKNFLPKYFLWPKMFCQNISLTKNLFALKELIDWQNCWDKMISYAGSFLHFSVISYYISIRFQGVLKIFELFLFCTTFWCLFPKLYIKISWKLRNRFWCASN